MHHTWVFPSGKNWIKNHVIECCFFLSCLASLGMHAYQLNTYLSSKCVFVYCTAAQIHQAAPEQEQKQMHILSHRHKSKLTRTICKLSFFECILFWRRLLILLLFSCSSLSFTLTKRDSSPPSFYFSHRLMVMVMVMMMILSECEAIIIFTHAMCLCTHSNIENAAK